MTERDQIKRKIFKVLDRMGGDPLMNDTLVDSVRILIQPRPTVAEILTAIEELQIDGWIFGVRDEVYKTQIWKLTDKGRLQAAKP